MKHLFFLLTLLFCLPLTAQQTYRARVVDAETGEALPYASVTSSSGRKVLTNDHLSQYMKSLYYFVIEHYKDTTIFANHQIYRQLSNSR